MRDPAAFAPARRLELRVEKQVQDSSFEMSNRQRILVIDDDVDIVDMLTDQLSISGEFSVSSATTALEAMTLVKAEPFDLLIMDIGLPDMDGREAVRVLRAGGARMPII